MAAIPTAFSIQVSPGKGTGYLHRSQGIHRQNIRDADIVILRLAHIRHPGLDARKHIAYVRLFLTVNVADLAGL